MLARGKKQFSIQKTFHKLIKKELRSCFKSVSSWASLGTIIGSKSSSSSLVSNSSTPFSLAASLSSLLLPLVRSESAFTISAIIPLLAPLSLSSVYASTPSTLLMSTTIATSSFPSIDAGFNYSF